MWQHSNLMENEGSELLRVYELETQKPMEEEIPQQFDRELSLIIWKGVFESSFNSLAEIAANIEPPKYHGFKDVESAEYLANCLLNIMRKSHNGGFDTVTKALELLWEVKPKPEPQEPI
jgi:hypothetical protein